MNVSRIGVIGSLMVDITIRVPVLPNVGQSIFAQEIVHGFGGKGCNISIALTNLGASVIFCSYIGNDEQGSELISNLKNIGIDVQNITVQECNTGIGKNSCLSPFWIFFFPLRPLRPLCSLRDVFFFLCSLLITHCSFFSLPNKKVYQNFTFNLPQVYLHSLSLKIKRKSKMKNNILLCLCVLIGTTAWADSSTILDIDSAVSRALENNLSLKRSEMDTLSAKRKYDRSWNGLIPSLTAGAMAAHPTSITDSVPPQSDMWTPGFSLSASLSITPAIFANIDQTKQEYEAGRINYAAARQELEFQVRRLYYQILLLKANMELAELNMGRAECLTPESPLTEFAK